MNLKTVRIRGFRNLNLDVEFTAGLNVMVGPNNSGKTNLFDAIRHALGPAANRSEPLWMDEDDLRRDPSEGNVVSNGTISISLAFSGLSDDERANFFEVIDFQATRSIQKAEAKVHFEAKWDDERGRFQVSRWGGPLDGDRSAVPQQILEALPVVFLPALRDAEAELTPGNRSVLARVLADLARRDTHDHEHAIEAIFSKANEELEEQSLIKLLEKSLKASARKMAGVDYVPASVQAAPPEFKRILRTLRIVLRNSPISDLSASGLGYNNLLYISSILSHLEESPAYPECPVLLVEEPEAHLSPQLTVLLGEYLSTLKIPQVIVSSHSPTFAATVLPSQVLMLSSERGASACHAIRESRMSDDEERQLQRMMDITRATLYFARGIVLVEGISEALLLPELAKKLGFDLSSTHVSVLPICGVSFSIFAKLFNQANAFPRVAIISDADPPVVKGTDKDWKHDVPDWGKKCARLSALEKIFKDHQAVEVFNSTVTLEYDLALAGENNALVMASTWDSMFQSGSRSLNSERIAGLSPEERSLQVWRSICRAPHGKSKAEFAHLLAERMQQAVFAVPEYIESAIRAVIPKEQDSTS